MKERLAAIAVVVLLLGGFLVFRPRGEVSAEATIQASFDAAKRGAVREYLACFGGDLARQLEAARREAGDEPFARGLQARTGQIQGLVLSGGGAAEPGEEDTVLQVEVVFRDRNEVQDYKLTNQWGRWRIVWIGPSTSVKMPIPYGTPVFPAEDTSTPTEAGDG